MTVTRSPSMILADYQNGALSQNELEVQAESLGWDSADYYELCTFKGDAWYPSVAKGAPSKDYSIIDHCLDFLRTL